MLGFAGFLVRSTLEGLEFAIIVHGLHNFELILEWRESLFKAMKFMV